MANHAAPHGEAHHPTGYTHYFVIWGILLVMTLVALGAGYFELPEPAKALLLVGVTLAKIVIIAVFFMHLKSEKRDLWILTLSPLILAVIFFSFTYGEIKGMATHKLIVRPAQRPVSTAAPHAEPAKH